MVRSTDGKIFSTGGISDGENSLNNLRSVYVTDGTSLQSRKLESRMKVGRATHACLATALKVMIHNALIFGQNCAIFGMLEAAIYFPIVVLFFSIVNQQN